MPFNTKPKNKSDLFLFIPQAKSQTHGIFTEWRDNGEPLLPEGTYPQEELMS